MSLKGTHQPILIIKMANSYKKMNVHNNKWNLLSGATSVQPVWDFQGMVSVYGGN